MAMPSVGDIQQFFFRAMVEGWAIDGTKTKPPDLPGHKRIDFHDGAFRLVDQWCVALGSPGSWGTTTIWYQDQVIWVMQYGGEYRDEDALALVKRALHDAYARRAFYGGRGIPMASQGDLTYTNMTEVNTFASFWGFERVDHHRSGCLGHHRYQGGLLYRP